MTFRRRTYAEVLDNILTGLMQGVSAETHPFPPSDSAPLQHILEHESVATVVSVYGSRNGQPHRFADKSDYAVNGKTVTWQEKGDKPDVGTLVSINYLPANSRAAVTDIYPGSVLRTVSETVALEIGRLYAQLEAVYQAGFIDTASGSALDRVVALLDIERVTGNHPVGAVVFTRAGGSRGVITIPAGTRIATKDAKIEYETTETVTLLAGQQTVRARAQDVEPANSGIDADLLIVLPVPIAGIERVTNPAATSITAQAESDDELRMRAKSFLAGSERATVGALKHAVERQGVAAEIVENTATPGFIQVNTFSDDIAPEQAMRIRAAIADARPAGVFVNPPAVIVPGNVSLDIRLVSVDGLPPADLRAIQSEVRKEVTDFFAKLPTKADASLNKLVGLVLGIAGVEDMQLLSAKLDGTALDTSRGSLALAGRATVLGSLSIADPALPTLLIVTVTHPPATPLPDREQITVDLRQRHRIFEQHQRASRYDRSAARSFLVQIACGDVGCPTNRPRRWRYLTPTAVPLPTAADPYTVTFAITQESGVSQLLTTAADTYTLTPFEQLSLNGVEVAESS